MDHGIAHLDTGRVAVDQDTADFLLQQRHQPGEGLEVFRFADQGGGQLATQAEQGITQLRIVLGLDGHGGGAEDFFLQQGVGLHQQAGIGLEQLGAGLAAFLGLAGQVLDAGVGMQMLQATNVAAQATGVEHGLPGLLVEMLAEVGEQLAVLRRLQADDQARVGAELPGAHAHGACQLTGDGLATLGQGARQDDHRVDAGHLGEHRDRLRAFGGHAAQGVTAFERASEADGLDGRVLDQGFADAATEDHVEHALGHAGAFGGALDGATDQVGGGHVAAVRLEHHRATGGQCGRGVTAGGGEGQGEVAGTEHGDRADADAHLAQIHAWQWLALGQGQVDARTEEVATAQDLGEQAHLAAGAATFTLDAGGRQGGFAADDGDERVVQFIQFGGDGVEEFGAACWRQLAEFDESCGSGLGGLVDFRFGGLGEAVGQGLASGGVQALQALWASGAALAGDEVVAEDLRHGMLLCW